MNYNEEPKRIGDVTESCIKRLMDIPRHLMTPEEEVWVKCKQEVDAAKTKKLRSAWNAPERHTAINPNVGGMWGDVYARLVPMVGTGLMVAFIGGRGNGKTQMAIELMRHATATGKSAYYDTTTALFMALKATFHQGSGSTEASVIGNYRKPRLLVLDEVGRKGESAWHDNLLFELVNGRYNDVKDTILICNLTVQALTDAVGPSLVDRINESGGIIEFTWPSFRAQKA